MEQGRTGDLVLPQGTYVHILEGATGQVDVISGPNKTSLPETDKTVIYERESRRFSPTGVDRAIRVCPTADEGQYLVLTNPSEDMEGRTHPAKGKVNTVKLSIGSKINIQGPETFSLFPGQVADVIDGHQLKSNEYLLIRVYNEKEAKQNLKNAVVQTAEGETQKGNLFDNKEIGTGNLLIIKGTDVSFYIPPTGIEVLEENGNYTRDAVTLERLEYCILLDQNGDKRYVKGPDVVFPKPTETFIENKKQRIFRAIELNENMGLYIKVIAEYEEDKKTFKAGEELFITGKEQKIYFPRAEHAIVKYGQEAIHYATAVPKGEGRYILDKINGDVKLVKGPKMLLADPRSEVIVKRVLNTNTVGLWFPGNEEALRYNLNLNEELEGTENDYLEDYSSRSFTARTKQTLIASAAAGMMSEELERKTNYTKPRIIKLDTKYEGAVLLNIWPNHAVQVVDKQGMRKVVEGPKVVMLDYDQTLEVLSLSTGKPKTDHDLMKTVYLQTRNNVVSDIITIETKDLINVDVRLSYKVNFEGDSTKWFNVSDYVKLLSQHMRSLIRNAVKKLTIEEFNNGATDIIRNCILGSSKEGKRKGRSFDENGMKIYDVEVLNLNIGDHDIASMLIDNQHDTVEQNLKIAQLEKALEYTKKKEGLKRLELDEKLVTSNKETEVALKQLGNENSVDVSEQSLSAGLEKNRLTAENDNQKTIDSVAASKLKRDKANEDTRTTIDQQRSAIKTEAYEKAMAAFTPRLIEALIAQGNVKLADTLAKNLKSQKGGAFGKGGGMREILETIGDGPLKGIFEKLQDSVD